MESDYFVVFKCEGNAMLFLNEENKQRFIWGWDWNSALYLYAGRMMSRS